MSERDTENLLVKRGWETTSQDEEKFGIIDIEKLWEITKDSPSFEIESSKLWFMLDLAIWSSWEGKRHPTEPEQDLAPRQVLEHPELSSYHWKAIQKADLRYPILVFWPENKRWPIDVLDGLHRLSKVFLQKGDTIRIKKVNQTEIQQARCYRIEQKVCLHCFLGTCHSQPCKSLIGTMFTRNQKKVLRRFVLFTKRDATDIMDYMEGGLWGYEYVMQGMRDRMWNEIATEPAISALKTIPATDHLKVELLQPYLLPENARIDEPHIINRRDHPTKDQEIFTFPPEFWKQLFYPRSFRRIRDMSKFWTMYVTVDFKYFRNGSKSDWRIPSTILDEPLLVSLPTTIYENTTWSIPVIRYQEGMSGMYWGKSDPDQKFCGTFFYFEPDSDSHLLTTKLLVAKNKFNACKLVGISVGKLYDMYLSNWILGSYGDLIKLIFIEFLKDEWIQSDTGLEPTHTNQLRWVRQFVRILYNGELEPVDKAVGWIFDFDTHYRELYAFEDPLDQLLCDEAKAMGIDTILLTRMTGSTRLVSEVLDMRDRKTMFKQMWINREDETIETLML
jgi:hypothetical protein